MSIWDARESVAGLDMRRYEQAMAEGWRLERLPDGRCNIYPPEMHVVMWQAPNLAVAVAALKLEYVPEDGD